MNWFGQCCDQPTSSVLACGHLQCDVPVILLCYIYLLYRLHRVMLILMRICAFVCLFYALCVQLHIFVYYV